MEAITLTKVIIDPTETSNPPDIMIMDNPTDAKLKAIPPLINTLI